MVYKYRVTLTGIKGFFRLYLTNASNTLYSLHKHLRDELEFPVDQPILFKALDSAGNVIARYALVDLGFGSVDNVTIADTIKAGAASFVYFYDTRAKKSVTLTLEGQDDRNTAVPVCVETKGPVPAEFENGYVAFEDMPKEHRNLHVKEDEPVDDDEIDEDEEKEDSEEEEIIYDENE